MSDNRLEDGRALRVYVDTSVFGGAFDDEFALDSRRFFRAARTGQVRLLVSLLVTTELKEAPLRVRRLLQGLPEASVEFVELTPEVLRLRDAYLLARVVGPARADDATHVAAATVARADAIVSWNFKHIVRLDRIKGFNAINHTHGFGPLVILSPREVRFDAREED